MPNIGGNTVDFVPFPVPPPLTAYEFSDATGGDGDGVLEEGETIGLTFTFENSRPDTMIGTTITLSCEDITIDIIR